MITLTHKLYAPVQFNDYKEFSNWCKFRGYKVSHMYKDGVDGWTRVTKRQARAAQVAPETINEVTYETIKEDFNYRDDKACCSVVSMAVALQIPFAKAQSYLKSSGRVHGRGVHMAAIKDAYIKAKHCLVKNREYTAKSMTIAQACREFSEGTHILSINGHILTITNGVPQDWTKTNSRHRVTEIFNARKIVSYD